MENNMAVLQNIKSKITIWSSKSTPGYILEGTESKIQKDNYTPMLKMTQSCLWVSRSLQQRRGSAVGAGLKQGGGTEWSSARTGSFEGGDITFITSTIVWPQVNSREGTQPHPSTEN